MTKKSIKATEKGWINRTLPDDCCNQLNSLIDQPEDTQLCFHHLSKLLFQMSNIQPSCLEFRIGTRNKVLDWGRWSWKRVVGGCGGGVVVMVKVSRDQSNLATSCSVSGHVTDHFTSYFTSHVTHTQSRPYSFVSPLALSREMATLIVIWNSCHVRLLTRDPNFASTSNKTEYTAQCSSIWFLFCCLSVRWLPCTFTWRAISSDVSTRSCPRALLLSVSGDTVDVFEAKKRWMRQNNDRRRDASNDGRRVARFGVVTERLPISRRDH